MNTSPHLILMTPPLQGHKIPLIQSSPENKSPCYQISLGETSHFLSHLLPTTLELFELAIVDDQWMVNSASKRLTVNNEPVYTAILEKNDIIQFGKLRCRFSPPTEDTQPQAKLGKSVAKHEKVAAISAALTVSLLAIATSYAITQ